MEKLSIRKVNGKSFSYFAVIVRIKIQKILCPIFVIVVTYINILCRSYYYDVGSVFCVYRCGRFYH